jgi:hypothetical protein
MSHQPYSGDQIRSSLVAYSIGKAISAPLSLLLILLLASVMQRAEYASYIAAAAVLEICVVLGTFGVEWVMQTSLAAIRVHGNGLQLRRAVFRLGAVPFVSYGLLGTALWMQADRVSELLGGVAAPDLLRVYAVVLVLEGPARILRDSLMAVLLLQRIGQVSLVVRVVAVFVMVAAVLLTGHTLDAIALGRIEIAAAAIGLLIALGGLIHQLRSERQSMSRSLPAGSAWAHAQAGPRDASIAPWVGWRSLRFAGHAYFSIVLMLLVGTDVMTALVARCLGAEATAAFGFVVRLVEMARRYLPMDLFWGVVRPAAIGRYEAGGQDRAALMQDCNRMVDANLIAVGFVLSMSLAVGDTLVDLLSQGQFAHARTVLVALLPILASHTIRRGVELMAYVRGRSGDFARAAVACLLAPPLTVLLLRTGEPAAAPFAVLVADGLFIVLALRAMDAVGESLDFNLTRWGRLALTCVFSALLGLALRSLWPSQAGTVLAFLMTGSAFVLIARKLALIDATEWSLLGQFMRSRVRI